jgi:hypothetical protein
MNYEAYEYVCGRDEKRIKERASNCDKHLRRSLGSFPGCDGVG